MTLPYAVIIAGGAGERLGGVRKADLRLGGTTFVERVMARLGPIAGPLMISTGPSDNPGIRRQDAVAVPDLAGDLGGPLAGLAAAIAHLRGIGIEQGLLVTVAVDTPLLPEDFVERLAAGIGSGAAAYAAWGDQFYPPNAIWRIEALRDLPDAVTAGRAPRSLKVLLKNVNATGVDWSTHTAANPFTNVNTLEDLITLSRMAQSAVGKRVIHKTVN